MNQEELPHPCGILASYNDCNVGNPITDEWILYVGIDEYERNKYNQKNGTNYTSNYDVLPNGEYLYTELKLYSDEPRIGGYPDRIITSYEDMLDFMKTGYTNSYGDHYEFYYDEERYPIFMKEIENFFIEHPKGVITFG